MRIIKKVIYIILTMIISLVAYSTIVKAATTLKVTADNLNLRKSASTTASILTLMSKGDTCELVEESGDWYKVKYKTYTGYISKKYVKEETTSTDNTGTDNSNDATQEQDNSNTYTEITGKLSKKTDVRIVPLIYSSIISNVDKNKQVTIISETNGWSYIQTDSISGWIRSDSIIGKNATSDTNNNTSKPAESTNTNNNDNNTTSDNNTSSNNTNSNSTEYTKKTMYVNDSYVNLRKEPNTSAKVVMVVSTNTKLTVIGESGDWYKVTTSSGDAYVSKKLLSDNKVSTTSRSGEIRTQTTTVAQTSETSTTSTNDTSVSKTETVATNTTTTSSSKGEEIVAYAKQFLGVPYVYGGASKSGFDCSGFTMYVYKKFGISMRHGAQAQAKLGTAVKADKSSASSLKNNLKPGDLVFFLDYETMDEIGHCGIYIGNGNFIHASSGSGYCVKINSLLPGEYYNTRYCAARRVI